MQTCSLDWNCVISVEQDEAAGEDVIALVDMHRKLRAEVAVLQTSATESMRGTRELPGSYVNFEARLSALGWADLPRVPTPGAWGLSFWGQSFYVDKLDCEARILELWNAIFPAIPRDFANYLALDRLSSDTPIGSAAVSKWRNAWCDVHSAYSHIHAKRDHFVTLNIRDFKKPSVFALGLNAVTPAEAIAII